MRRDLLGLRKDVADDVARHLVAAGTLLEADPDQALAHARYARGKASRLAIVREAVGLAAYRAGEWTEAIAELRAARRMGGGPGHLPVMADAERALGRPERALELFRSPEAAELDRADAIELLIVASGARRDLGEVDAAVVSLQVPELDPDAREPWSARLSYAYADALLAADRRDEAVHWFLHAAQADDDELTDAADRLSELAGDDQDDSASVGSEDGAEALESDDVADMVTSDDVAGAAESDDVADVDESDDDTESTAAVAPAPAAVGDGTPTGADDGAGVVADASAESGADAESGAEGGTDAAAGSGPDQGAAGETGAGQDAGDATGLVPAASDEVVVTDDPAAGVGDDPTEALDSAIAATDSTAEVSEHATEEGDPAGPVGQASGEAADDVIGPPVPAVPAGEAAAAGEADGDAASAASAASAARAARADDGADDGADDVGGDQPGELDELRLPEGTPGGRPR